MEEGLTQKEQMEVAQMRFGLIAPVIQGTYADASASAYCRRVAQTLQTLPDGRKVLYKPKTLEKWITLYRRGGMDALLPKTRCDKGNTRVITPEAEREIHRLKREYPRLNATQIHARPAGTRRECSTPYRTGSTICIRKRSSRSCWHWTRHSI